MRIYLILLIIVLVGTEIDAWGKFALETVRRTVQTEIGRAVVNSITSTGSAGLQASENQHRAILSGDSAHDACSTHGPSCGAYM